MCLKDILIFVVFQGNNVNVGIHSVVAIPYDEWSLNFIRPSSVCVKKDGQCVEASFPNPPESKKIHFDQEQKGNTTFYVSLNANEPMIDLKGKVSTPGFYVFIVHYYQPFFTGEHTMNIIIEVYHTNLDFRVQLGYFDPERNVLRSEVTFNTLSLCVWM